MLLFSLNLKNPLKLISQDSTSAIMLKSEAIVQGGLDINVELIHRGIALETESIKDDNNFNFCDCIGR